MSDKNSIKEHLLADKSFKAAKQQVLALTAAELRDVQRAMRQVANGRITSVGCGICYNTEALCANSVRRAAYYVVNYFSYGWPHHSGCVGIPVPYSLGDSDSDIQYWQGQQLAYRQSLMAYIIEQIDLFLAYQIEREGKENDYEG